MEKLIKINSLSKMYNVSARTLRYYEDVGLIKSIRSEDYAYRLYDEASVIKLEKILILRKLNISIKDIRRIFNTEGSEIILDILHKKVNSINDEILLLNELKDIVLEFIVQIKQTDFHNSEDIKLLYNKTKEIEFKIANTDYSGNSSPIHRLIEVTEKLDKQIPDIFVVRINKFRALTSGVMPLDKIFGGNFLPWVEEHKHLFKPIIFDAVDFLTGKDDKFEWIWSLKDGVTEKDIYPYSIREFEGGLYAAAVSLDGDGESHNKVRSKIDKWLENTNFETDSSQMYLGHMIYDDEEIFKGLGYNQMSLYTPIKLKKENYNKY